MRKTILILILLAFVISCNLLNLHNVKNDFRWKNKKLSENIEIHLIFNPLVIKSFDSSSTLKYFFEESDKITEAEHILKNKLSKRNFTLIEFLGKNTITIDTLLFSDEAEMMSVLSNDASEVLGYYEKNDIKLKIIGSLNVNDTIKAKITSEYEFIDEPREGFVIKGMISYTNSWINLDKVMNNILNEFSFKCFQEITEN